MDINNVINVSGTVATPVEISTLQVNFGNGIVSGFADKYVDAINRKAMNSNGKVEIDASELQRYLNFILIDRIKQTSGMKPAPKFITRNLLIPSLYSLAILHIGTVYDKDLGIRLVPVINEDEVDAMTPDEAAQFSLKLTYIQDLGFEMAKGLPKDTEGDPNFMYFHMSEDTVLRHNNTAHPGYATLAVFFRMKQLEETLTWRVNYGLIQEYDLMLSGLIYDSARQ